MEGYLRNEAGKISGAGKKCSGIAAKGHIGGICIYIAGSRIHRDVYRRDRSAMVAYCVEEVFYSGCYYPVSKRKKAISPLKSPENE